MEVLKKYGWPVSEDGVYNYFGDDTPTNGNAIHDLLMNSDLRELVKADGVESTGRINLASGISLVPLVMQIQTVRNVAVPKEHENDPDASSRLLRLTLTDGKTTISALEMSPVKGLDAKTPPGTKIQLKSPAKIEKGFLLLSSSNCQILGGHVEKLVEKWTPRQPKMDKAQRSAVTDGQSGPPPWVPFSQQAANSNDIASLGQNIRVMDLAGSNQQAPPPVSEEFTQGRQQQIAQVMNMQRENPGRHVQN